MQYFKIAFQNLVARGGQRNRVWVCALLVSQTPVSLGSPPHMCAVLHFRYKAFSEATKTVLLSTLMHRVCDKSLGLQGYILFDL